MKLSCRIESLRTRRRYSSTVPAQKGRPRMSNIRSIEEIVRDIEKLRDEVQELLADSSQPTEAPQHASSKAHANAPKITGVKLRA